MNHVYLILANKDPDQLNRLVNRLRYPNTLFVIHLETAIDQNAFIGSVKGLEKDVLFLEKRVETQAGSIEWVEATLNGLRFIVENIAELDRVTLLSGLDYPIKPVVFINNYLQARPDTVFITFYHLAGSYWSQIALRRFPGFDKISKKMKLYGGSQWWSLPVYAIRTILSLLDENPHFINYFRLVKIPSESFFQTLLLNSEEPVILDNIENENLKLEWWNAPHPHPHTTHLEDLHLLLTSKKLFGGKFDSIADTHLLNDLDDTILNPDSHRKFRKNNSNNKPVGRQAVTMLTNNLAYLKRYNKLQNEITEEFTPYLLFHNTSGINHNDVTIKGLFQFDNSILNSLNFKPIADTLVPGSNHFPLLSFYKANPGFEYYWLIEDDVYFNGSWRDFLKDFSLHKNRADFISCYVRAEEYDPDWGWWGSLQQPYLETASPVKKIASFNPIYRISNKALKFLYEQLLKGWSGHHEVLIPTLLHNAGFSILDFGVNGDFCDLKPQEIRYIRNREVDGQIQPGSFRYRPVINPEEITKNILYHPVKINPASQILGLDTFRNRTARLALLKDLKILFSNREMYVFNHLMEDSLLSQEELEIGVKLLNKIIRKNSSKKLYSGEALFDLFQDILNRSKLRSAKNFWNLDADVLEFIKSKIEMGSQILEFGSGNGTDKLLKNFKVASIEHDNRYILRRGRSHKIFHAPLSNGWYNASIVKKALQKKQFNLIVVDGPPGNLRANILNNLDCFKGLSCPIVFDDMNRELDRSTMEDFCKEMNYSYLMFKGKHKEFAYCTKCS